MWQPEGEKLTDTAALGTLDPVKVLAEQNGPKVFTCKDQNEDLLLAYLCGEENKVRRYVVVPFTNKQATQLTSGALSVRDALSQSPLWVVDVGDNKQIASAWTTELSMVPENDLPKAGVKLADLPKQAAPAPAAKVPAPPAPAAKPGAPAAPGRPAAKSGRMNIERMMHRNSMQVMSESAATYCLVKLIPSGESKGPPLNIALVLDVSGSMFAEDGTGRNRLRRIQEAAKLALEKLRPEDTLAIVGFAYDAKVLLTPTPVSDKAQIADVIDKIEDFGIDPGGTAMDEGIKLGMEEVEKNFAPERLSQVIILTDGETTGERICRDLAQQAGEKHIHLTLMGIGTEWNAALLKELAKVSLGKWHYIDVTLANDTERVILEEFATLAATGFLNVEMHIRAVKNVKVKRVRQVAPEIQVMDMKEPEERHLVANLGTLVRDNPTKYIVDLSVPKRPDGKYAIAQLEISFDPGTGKRESTNVPLEVTYTSSGHGYINAEVAKHIDEVQIAELNDTLQQAIAKDDKAAVQQVAAAMVKKGEVMGKAGAKKTMLAKQVLQEINAGGRVSKKTQLAMDDAAREAQS